MLTDTKTLIARFERQAHRMGELWERCQGKGWPDAESTEFTALRDERLPAMRAALEAIEAAACAPLLERIAALEKQLAYADDAAKKGDDARAAAGGMEMRIAELEAERDQVRWLFNKSKDEFHTARQESSLRWQMICDLTNQRDALEAMLAAAPAAPEQQEPDCLKCGNNRQVWTNQISGEKVCHRVGCHEVVPLTHDQIENGAEIGEFDNLCRWQIFEAGVRFAEAAHGIGAPAKKGCE